MNILRAGLALSITFALLLPATASADPVTRAEVERALGGYEQGPDVAAVRAWGAVGARILMDVSRDPQGLLGARARALHALRAFPGDGGVRAFLRATAAAPEQNLFLVRASLDALLEAFDDVPEVARYLADSRVDVRDGAAWSLAASHDPAARAALVARLRVEADPTVRDTITRCLQRSAAPVGATVPAVTTPARTRAAAAATARRR